MKIEALSGQIQNLYIYISSSINIDDNDIQLLDGMFTDSIELLNIVTLKKNNNPNVIFAFLLEISNIIQKNDTTELDKLFDKINNFATKNNIKFILVPYIFNATSDDYLNSSKQDYNIYEKLNSMITYFFKNITTYFTPKISNNTPIILIITNDMYNMYQKSIQQTDIIQLNLNTLFTKIDIQFLYQLVFN